MDRIAIYDTTLRDGLQAPGISLDVEQKVALAKQIERMGVDVIEAGAPFMGEDQYEAVQAIGRAVGDAVVSAAALPVPELIDRAWDAVRVAARPRLYGGFMASRILMETYETSEDDLRAQAKNGIAHMRSLCDDVAAAAGDATRADRDFLCELFQLAVDSGATTLTLADTVGRATPEEFAALVRHVLDNVQGDYVVSTHCHDDLGLAVANSLAAVRAGAGQVECTVNGIGERAGNASLEEVVMVLDTRRDLFGAASGVRTEELTATSAMVSEQTGFVVAPNKAIVGRNAFAQGLHAQEVQQNRETFQIIDPARVGAAAAPAKAARGSSRSSKRRTASTRTGRRHG